MEALQVVASPFVSGGLLKKKTQTQRLADAGGHYSGRHQQQVVSVAVDRDTTSIRMGPSPINRVRVVECAESSSVMSLGIGKRSVAADIPRGAVWSSSGIVSRRRGSSSRVSVTTTAEGELADAAASYPFSFEDEKSSCQGNSRDRNLSSNGKSGASSVSSGVRLEHISKTFKGQTVLKDVSWEVKKGEKVGLVGVNGAGKTTQLRIIAGEEKADSGSVIKMRHSMKIAFPTQDFEVVASRTVREEFLSAFAEQMTISAKIEKVQKALETATDDVELMAKLLDELDRLQRQAEAADMYDVDVKINNIMAELSFSMEDADQLVAAYSGGWQMRMSLGKILLQEPDLLLLDEPTNHLDLDTIEWLEGYLKKQEVPMVIVSHDRAFLDQLCTKIVETDMGVSSTFEGNYSEYVNAKAAWIETQRLAWEKQQKEISRTEGLIQRLSGGANTGRATSFNFLGPHSLPNHFEQNQGLGFRAGPSLQSAAHLGALGFSHCPCFCGKLSPFSRQRRNPNGLRYQSRGNLKFRSQMPTHDDIENSDEGAEESFDGRVSRSIDGSEGGDPGSSRGQQPRIPYGFVTALALVGFLETAYLTWGKLSGTTIACTVDGSCTDVLDSSYATVFGIPLALIGMLAYGALCVLGSRRLLSSSSSEWAEEEKWIRWLTLGITTSMGIASTYFMYILMVKLEGASCAYCVSSAVLSLTLLLCSLRGFTGQDITKVAGLQVGVGASVVLALSVAYADADAALARSQNVDLPFVEPEVVTSSSPREISIAKHLQSVGARMYGAFWCSHCFEQKEMFGREAMKYIDYVECYPEGYRKGVQIAKACDAANIQGFPTWIINGKVLSGEQDLEDLAKASDFDKVRSK